MNKRTMILIMGLMAMAAVSVMAATIHVPADQPTIQAGINAAVDGDTVLVAPGVYYEDLHNLKSVYLLAESETQNTILHNLTVGLPALSAANVELTIRGFVFSECTASAAVSLDRCKVTLTKCKVCDNSVSQAAVLIKGNSDLAACALVHGCVFRNNEGGQKSAGLCLMDMSEHSAVEQCEFSNNTGAHGGGITLWNAHNIRLCRNLIYSNTVSGYGGGIALVNTSSDDTLVNNTVAYNTSAWNGGGIFLNGGGISLNNVVVGNQGLPVGGIAGGEPTTERDYNDVHLNIPANYSTNDPGEHDISADPLFQNVALYDFGLSLGSPCIDAGDPSPEYDDPDGTRNDMGAFFFQRQPWAMGINFGCEQSHVIEHTPTIYWSFFDTLTTLQTAFEVQVGSDNDWSIVEMWNPGVLASGDTSVIYSGSPLVDGMRYWGRIRVSSLANWGGWNPFAFRMNSIPSPPLLRLPLPGALVPVHQPELVIRNSSDAESDSLLYTFAVSPDSFMSTIYTFTKKQSPDSLTALIVDSVLAENARYWWRVKASDYYEQSDYSEIRSFWVNGENSLPTPFVLILPPDTSGGPLTTLLPYFVWSPSSDPDPLDGVRYSLNIALDANFNFVNTIDALTATSYTLIADDSLDWGTRYWWKVRAYDYNGGNTWSTQVLTFRTITLGDANNDGEVDISDAVYLIAYIFSGGPAPSIAGDANCDHTIDISDAVYLIAFIFSGGPEPCAAF